MNLEKYIRSVMDFPIEGINFRDITTLLAEPKAFSYTIDKLVETYENENIDRIGAFDARGFLFGAPMAIKMDLPFFPVRKAGKLPYTTIEETYGLEYGEDKVEIHTDAVNKGDNVLLIDDLLATGGTMYAGCKLVEKLEGNVVSCGFVIELTDLPGREKLQGYDIKSLLQYQGE